MSFASPKAIVNALNPFGNPMTKNMDGDRVESFRRYIENLEKKGGGEVGTERKHEF